VECSYCREELKYHDFYGANLHLDSFGGVQHGFNKSGDIYKCDNEECDCFGGTFYTRNGELKEGYPC